MRITDGLLGEHALFYPLFDALEQVMDDATTTGEIQRAFDVVRPAVLSHAEIEDEMLFPSIGEQGPVSVMRAEHREIDTLAMGVSRAKTIDEARSAGQRLVELLRDHFHKEEHVLFPMAASTIEPSRLEALGERYKAKRNIP